MIERETNLTIKFQMQTTLDEKGYKQITNDWKNELLKNEKCAANLN